MALHTYTFEYKRRGLKIQVKAKKEQAERIVHRVLDVDRLPFHVREISNYSGEDRTSEYLTIGGSAYAVRDPEGYETRSDAFFAGLPEPVTPENFAAQLAPEIKAIFDAHIHIEDKRQTPEQRQAERDESTRIQLELDERRARETQTFLAQYGSDTTIKRGERTAIVAELTKDDSDGMSDYYCPFGSVAGAVDLALGLVSIQPKTESIARSMVNRYPELAAHTFTWHVENYSGGHGNYLVSNFFDHNYADGEVIRARWTVSFDRHATELHTFKGYPGTGATLSAGDTAESNTGATVTRNYQHNGIEVRFAAKPAEDVLDSLRSHGFRFSFRQRIWYAQFSDTLMKWAQDTFTPGHNERVQEQAHADAALIADTTPEIDEPVDLANAPESIGA